MPRNRTESARKRANLRSLYRSLANLEAISREPTTPSDQRLDLAREIRLTTAKIERLTKSLDPRPVGRPPKEPPVEPQPAKTAAMSSEQWERLRPFLGTPKLAAADGAPSAPASVASRPTPTLEELTSVEYPENYLAPPGNLPLPPAPRHPRHRRPQPICPSRKRISPLLPNQPNQSQQNRFPGRASSQSVRSHPRTPYIETSMRFRTIVRVFTPCPSKRSSFSRPVGL
jgi:hypothetical protein